MSGISFSTNNCYRMTSLAQRTANCNFESNWWCNWFNIYNDDFNWLRGSTTGGKGTGPAGDHTTGKGIWVFVLFCFSSSREF